MAKKEINIEQTDTDEKVTIVESESKEYSIDAVFEKSDDKKHFKRKDEKY